MANDLYRGYEIEARTDGTFAIIANGKVHSDGYPTADKAMDAIDAYRRAQLAA